MHTRYFLLCFSDGLCPSLAMEQFSWNHEAEGHMKGCLHQEGRRSWHPWELPWNAPPALESKLLIM